MSWPYSPAECPRCECFDVLEPPAVDDVGYEIVGLCLHPRIAMDVFVLKERDPATMAPCPCFRAKRERVGSQTTPRIASAIVRRGDEARRDRASER